VTQKARQVKIFHCLQFAHVGHNVLKLNSLPNHSGSTCFTK